MYSTILVVEDEFKLRQLLRTYLEREGLNVVTSETGADAILAYRSSSPDVVVLDLRLPDIPGEDVARAIREEGETAILMLTAKSSEEDRIRGLEIGADDYLTKPFSPRELVLRVKSLLRRSVVPRPDDGPVSFGEGEMVIDAKRRSLVVRGLEKTLTPFEWGIITSLALDPGRVYSRFELINRIRGYEIEGYERTVDTHVRNLRRKIEQKPSDPVIVVTVLGVGYKLGLSRDPLNRPTTAK